MAIISIRALLETGVHFGHRASRWNPKMAPYIFGERSGIHIIDLQQTIVAVEEAHRLVRDTVAEGGTVLFVGTKRQAQEAIEAEARRCGMSCVNQRWLGGTLTNWRTIRERIQYLKNLEARRDRGEFDLLTKKEALQLTRKIDLESGQLAVRGDVGEGFQVVANPYHHIAALQQAGRGRHLRGIRLLRCGYHESRW